jgi:hypothetical protein
MSTVCVLTPIVVGSWPALASAIVGAAGSTGFSLVETPDQVAERDSARRTVETEVPNSEVMAENLARGQKILIERNGVRIEFGIDERGRCTVCASGEGVSTGELRRIGDEVAGRVVQQFAYHKLVTELKTRGYEIASESVEQDQSIQLRVRRG